MTTNNNIRYETIKFPVTTKQFLITLAVSFMAMVCAYNLFAGGDNSFEVCQSNYKKATSDIIEYNTNNPKYLLQMPKYNCTELIKDGTGSLAPSSEVPPTITSKEVTLRDKFGLGDCRFINEAHKLPKYKLDWIGYDIACERGKSFDVKSPGIYKVEKIGFGYNIGNFIILRRVSPTSDENQRIVLGHIVTSLKEGYELSSGEIIGQTNLSGETTGMHIHIELWNGYMNVSREFLLNRDDYQVQDQTRLLNHRGWDFGQPSETPPVYYFTHYDLGDPNQNDSTPCIGASGKNLCVLEASGVRTMALTSDMRNALMISFGDKVKLSGDKGCEGIFQVEDEMNKRYRQTPGIKRPGTNYYIKGDLPSMEGGACSVTKI